MLVILLTALAAVLLRDDSEPAPCSVTPSSGEARPQLLRREELLPAGTVGTTRHRVVDAIEGLGGPVGQVVTGRFFEKLTERPSVVAYGDRLVLVTAPAAGRATVDVVDADAARTDWRVDLTGDPAWTTFTGGPVGDDLVLAFSGPEPALLTLGDDSAPLTCRDLPRTGPTTQVRTDQARADVVVASAGPDGRRVVRLVDPTSGTARWTRRGTGAIASVAATGDLVLLARADSASAATRGLPTPGPGPWLEALARSDGAPAWQVDEPGLLLTTGPDGTSYLLGVRGRARVIALDAQGRPRWTAAVPTGFRSAWLWGDRLVLRGPDPAGGTMLRAFDTTTGSPAWTVRSVQAPPVGDAPRTGLGTPLVEDGTAWVPAPNGLLEIDAATGRVTRHDSTARVDELLRLGDPAEGRVAVVSGTALLVTL